LIKRNSYITSLHAKEVGPFQELDVKFGKNFNFIVGPNASGKTSIIRCLSLCLTADKLQDFRYGSNSEIWTNFVVNDQKMRVGFGQGWIRDGNKYRRSGLQNWVKPSDEENLSSFHPNLLQNQKIPFFPLVIGAYRKITYTGISGMQKEPDIDQKIIDFRKMSPSYLDGLSLPNVKQWLINRYFIIDKEWGSYEKENWEYLLENLHQLSPRGIEFSFNSIKKDLEPRFNIAGNECFLEELSAGFQAILSLVFSIFDWIEGTNEAENKLVKEAVGTVIVDELDAHLHPEWQLSIRESLKELFPNLQFIITTHSPHLIASAKEKEIIILPLLSEGIVKVEPINKCYSGWNTDEILEEIMGVVGLENKLYRKIVSKAMDSLEEKNLLKLNETINQLERITHPSNTIVQVLKIRLASLKLEGSE